MASKLFSPLHFSGDSGAKSRKQLDDFIAVGQRDGGGAYYARGDGRTLTTVPTPCMSPVIGAVLLVRNSTK